MKKKNLILLVLCILSFAGQLALYPRMPDVVPTHWGMNGEVNGYSGRGTTLFIALMPLALLILFHFLPKIDPKHRSYAMHEKAYDIFCTVTTLFLVAVVWVMNAAIFGYPVQIQMIIPIGVGILLLVIGNYMPQIRPNYTFGIKTPWTLADEWVWKKTHAMGGILFCIMGGLMILCGFVQTDWSIYAAFGFILVSCIWLFVYSYLLFKRER